MLHDCMDSRDGRVGQHELGGGGVPTEQVEGTRVNLHALEHHAAAHDLQGVRASGGKRRPRGRRVRHRLDL
eukprot:scaffold130518_cov26-Tisochrysis_lutea.AAC.1